MDKKSFYDILCSTTPEELNELISLKGKRKMVNVFTEIPKEEEGENENESYNLLFKKRPELLLRCDPLDREGQYRDLRGIHSEGSRRRPV